MLIQDILQKYPRFASWAQQKKFHTNELEILEEVSDETFLHQLLTWIATHKISYSHGKTCLELAIELHLMNQDLQDIFSTQDPGILIQKLHTLRNPLTSKKHEEKSQIVQKLPWSSGVQARWKRFNDKAGLEVSFKSFSLKDLKAKLENLNKIYSKLEDKKDSLWTS